MSHHTPPRQGTRRLLIVVSGFLAVVLGSAAIPLTQALWSDNVYATAHITTASGGQAQTDGPNSGGISTGANTEFGSAPVWTNTTTVGQACVAITVTTQSETPVQWSLRLDTSVAPWNGATANYQFTWGYGFTGELQDGKYYTIVGGVPSNADTATVVSGQVRSFSICNWHAGEPPTGDSSWYSVSYATMTWTDTEACYRVSVSPTSLAPQFLFTWQTSAIDVTPLVAQVTAGTRTFNYWSSHNWRMVRTWAPEGALNGSTTSMTFAATKEGALSSIGLAAVDSSGIDSSPTLRFDICAYSY